MKHYPVKIELLQPATDFQVEATDVEDALRSAAEPWMDEQVVFVRVLDAAGRSVAERCFGHSSCEALDSRDLSQGRDLVTETKNRLRAAYERAPLSGMAATHVQAALVAIMAAETQFELALKYQNDALSRPTLVPGECG